MRISLRKKTIIGTAVIEGVLLLALILTAIGFLTNIIDENLAKRAQTTSSLFATATKDAILSYDLASLESFADELMKTPDLAYVRIYGPNNTLFTVRGNNELVQSTFKQDTALGDVNDGVFDTSSKVLQDGFAFGRIEMGLQIQTTQQAIAKVRAWSVSIAAIELFLVALFSYFLGTYLTRQLALLRKGSRNVRHAIRSGDFSETRVTVTGNDELSDLALSFNKLIESLQVQLATNASQQETLQILNESLEQKVSERTAELSKKNVELIQVNKTIKETQQQLLQAEKMASVGQLAAGVAHEINNPVGFVKSNLSTLRDYIIAYQNIADVSIKLAHADSSDDAQYSQYKKQLRDALEQEDLDFISEDVNDLLTESNDGLERVIEIVQGLRLFSRVDADEKQLFNVNDCIKTTLKMVNNELKYCCDVSTQYGDLPAITINPGKINQVLTNLLINAGHAIQATSLHGHILVKTFHAGSFVSIQIQDNGIGIEKESISKLFNPFFTTKEEGKGTGLGLSISIGIAVEHGGNLSVESEPGKGSTFTLTLPVNQKPVISQEDFDE